MISLNLVRLVGHTLPRTIDLSPLDEAQCLDAIADVVACLDVRTLVVVTCATRGMEPIYWKFFVDSTTRARARRLARERAGRAQHGLEAA